MMSPDCFFGLIATAAAIVVLICGVSALFYAVYWWDEFLRGKDD